MGKIKNALNILLLLGALGTITSCGKELNEPASSAMTITKIYPESGGNGDTIKVTGKNFLTFGSELSISINEKTVRILSITDSTLKVIIPKMAGSGVVMFGGKGKTYTGPAFTYVYRTIVTTIAGSGVASANDGAGITASFNCPWGITTDDAGHLFIADCYNRLIRKVNLMDKSVSTITINAEHFASPYNIAFDHKDNSIYVTDFNQHLMQVNSGGALNVIYTGTGPTTGIAAGPDGYLYMSNNSQGTIKRLNTSGGDTTNFSLGIITPRNIIFDQSNTMYVSGYDPATASAAIFKVDNTGKATVVHTDAAFKGWEIAVDAWGNFYEADHVANTIKIVEKSGHVVTIAGSGAAGDIDGIGLHAAFNGPQGLTIDKDGILYVTTYNYATAGGNKLRKVVIE